MQNYKIRLLGSADTEKYWCLRVEALSANELYKKDRKHGFKMLVFEGKATEVKDVYYGKSGWQYFETIMENGKVLYSI